MKKINSRVIIRKDFHTYAKVWGYIYGFIDATAKSGYIVIVTAYPVGPGGSFVFEPFDEIPQPYFTSKKIVHKNTPEGRGALGLLQEYIGNANNETFVQVERIGKSSSIYV